MPTVTEETINMTSSEIGANHSTTRAEKMKAIVQHEYGSADVLKLEDVDLPKIGNSEALIEVHAAGLDRGTQSTTELNTSTVSASTI